MPFCANGIRPDAVINPNCITSRMTIALLTEIMAEKQSCLTGHVADGTPFRGVTVEAISDVLHQHGFQKRGYERMYNGMSGEPLEALIFVGPAYYQRLKHVSVDKMHARSHGPVQLATRQPVEGRSKQGGLRFGEMERDALIGHGASSVTKDRLCDQSDAYEAVACKKCGLMGEPPKPRSSKSPENSEALESLLETDEVSESAYTRRAYCRNCKTSKYMRKFKVPYALKLLWQELMACHIALRFEFEDAEDE